MRLYAVDLNALFQEHHGELVRYLTHLTGDGDEAADAVQEAYLRLMSRPPAHDENLRAWLFTVATNVVRDGWKRQQRVLRLVQAPERESLQSHVLDPQAQLEQKERQQVVGRVLQTLTLKERTILLMREEGFSHKEIAEAVDTTTKSVGTMIARALRKLAGELGPAIEMLK